MTLPYREDKTGFRIWRTSYVRKIRNVSLLLISAWFIFWLAARFLIVNDPVERADAIVVLSGSSTLIERTHHAAQLYAQRHSQRILLTNDNRQGGWSAVEQRNPYFYERARSELTSLGVPDDHIVVISTPVHSTWEEALVIRDYSKTHQLRTILLVTSGYHSRRALWTFKTVLQAENVDVKLDVVETGIQTPSPSVWWLHLKGWQMVPGEYLKFAYYLVRYYV